MSVPTSTPKTTGFSWKLGIVALWLRNRFFLRILIFAGAVVASATGLVNMGSAICAKLPAECWIEPQTFTAWPWILLGAGITAGVAVILDFVADRHETKVSTVEAVAEIAVMGKAMSALIVLLGEIGNVGFERGSVRADRVKGLSSALAASSALISAAGDVRATFYSLSKETRGSRKLDDPVSRGRLESVTTVWDEADDPNAYVWKIMDRPDLEAEIANKPDSKFGIDWETKRYTSFISVPVKVKGVAFGMLSVNAPGVDPFSESDRLAVIAAARMLAAVLSLETGPTTMATKSAAAGIIATGGSI